MGKLKRNLIICLIMLCSLCYGADKKKEINVTASTSWTAAFADLAGVDNIKIIAPADLKHPPEYEITVSDVLNVSRSDYFIYAGFERMMETLGSTLGNENSVKMIKITCDNSIDTVVKNAALISEIIGTEEESKKRVGRYVDYIKKARKDLSEKGLEGASVLCHKHQVFLAKELGFNVLETFGPGPVTSGQLVNAKNGKFDFIIDNIHNPVGQPLYEVSPESKYIIWRNFPDKVEKNSLLHVIQSNVSLIF